MENFNLKKNVKFHFIEHHLAHIASAYFPLVLKSVGLSIDGSGDFVTCAIAKCENNKIKIVKKIIFSLAWNFLSRDDTISWLP